MFLKRIGNTLCFVRTTMNVIITLSDGVKTYCSRFLPTNILICAVSNDAHLLSSSHFLFAKFGVTKKRPKISLF